MNRKLRELQEKYDDLKSDYEWSEIRRKKLFEENKAVEKSFDKLQKDYESLFQAKQETEKRLTNAIHDFNTIDKLFNETRKKWVEYQDKYFGLFVRKVVHNKEKGTTVVWFYKNDKIIVKRRKGAKDDVYTAVAYAIAEKLYGSNTRFKKAIEDVKM